MNCYVLLFYNEKEGSKGSRPPKIFVKASIFVDHPMKSNTTPVDSPLDLWSSVFQIENGKLFRVPKRWTRWAGIDLYIFKTLFTNNSEQCRDCLNFILQNILASINQCSNRWPINRLTDIILSTPYIRGL